EPHAATRLAPDVESSPRRQPCSPHRCGWRGYPGGSSGSVGSGTYAHAPRRPRSLGRDVARHNARQLFLVLPARRSGGAPGFDGL
ncbi:MAG: hypothetical protein AVDCRST_MAG86-2862, partial [uncultured Truepera sp.]